MSSCLKVDSDIAAHLAVPVSAKPIRPLPAIPSPSFSSQVSPRSPRPLPSPPCPSPLSFASFRLLPFPSPSASPVSDSLADFATPEPSTASSLFSLDSPVDSALPVSPPMPVSLLLEFPTELPPLCRTQRERQKPSMSVPKIVIDTTECLKPAFSTYTDLLKPPDVDLAPPDTPISPQPPTPKTAGRKRLAKLRRHLGQSLLEEAVRVHARPGKRPPLSRRFSPVEEADSESISIENMFDINPDSDSSDGENEEYTWFLDGDALFQDSSEKHYSMKWMHDKGGRRWEESDYKTILRTIRAL